MAEKVYLDWNDVSGLCDQMALAITKQISTCSKRKPKRIYVYGVPRGGIPVASLLIHSMWKLFKIEVRLLINFTEEDDEVYIVDDIIDTGRTREKYCHFPFFTLVDKTSEDSDGWFVFPWERMQNEDGPENNVIRMLEYIGEDPNREGLKETPERVIRSYDKLYSGYKQHPKDVMKVFKDDDCDELVLLKGIEFHSTCEHHMLPFHGEAHIAYIPDGKVVGVSKLARILEIYTRRLQIQERIGEQVTTALMMELEPKGAACILEASHMCMTSRGVEKQHSIMVTSSLVGVFRENIETRNELMNMIKG